MCLCLSPPLNPRLHSAHLVRLKGVSRGDLEAGRGAAPAGSCTRHEHSGGSGAPPGPNTRSRREPADRAYGGVRPDRKPEARPGAGDAAMARREALACRKARNHLRTASFGAPSPFSCPKGEKSKARMRNTHRGNAESRLCPLLADGLGTIFRPCSGPRHRCSRKPARSCACRLHLRARSAPLSASSLDAPEFRRSRAASGTGIQGMARQIQEIQLAGRSC